MGNSSSQTQFTVQTPGQQNTVPGHVVMALDAAGNPQAVSNNNPMQMVDAYLAPTVTSWTSATPLNTAVTMNTAGMDTVALTILPTGTLTAGAITFEVYDGASWIPVKCARLSSYNTDSTFTLNSAATLQGWTVPAAGYPQFRFRLSAAIAGSGTVVITAIVSSAPDTSIVTAGLDPQQALHPGALTLQAQQVVAIGASSAVSAVVQATTNRVVLIASVACWVNIGVSPTAVANSAGNIYVPAGIPLPPIVVAGGASKIAVIQASAAGFLSIVESV